MKITPSLEEARRIAQSGEYRVLPVSCEMLSDRLTPIECLRVLKRVSKHCYLLESAADSERWGRYTFLGFDPALDITCLDGEMKVGSLRMQTDDPSGVLRQILSDYKSPRLPGLPPFTGGLVGYFAFDYLGYSEPSVRMEIEDSEHFQDVDVMLFDKVIAFDHFRQKIILIVNMRLDDVDTGYSRAALALKQLRELLLTGERWDEPGGRMTGPVEQLFSQAQYCVNPSPYMFYFSGTDVEVAGASPETLVKLEDGVLHTFPLAGTRPRGRTDAEDAALEAELLADEKELAEHNMLVDLGRNDLGRISRFGTVKVEKLHAIERFSHVMHIGSTVRGEIREDRDALDAIEAVLPAGTLSGAPKLRACQLIGELENNKRGIYGGAIGYIDFTGNMDTCIAIRIAWKKNGTVYVRSGAGIVADSVPEKEYQECVNKARAVMNALEQAGGIEE